MRFFRHQIGRQITLSFIPISGNEQDDGDVVVSCLLPPEQSDCFITSVDFIRLIALLVAPTGKNLSINAKNRIRRNLEVFHPVTIKKTDSKTAALFNYLMCMRDPKPVTISKDIKIFEWCALGDGLAKILAKYVSLGYAHIATVADSSGLFRRTASMMRQYSSTP